MKRFDLVMVSLLVPVMCAALYGAMWLTVIVVLGLDKLIH